MNKEEIEETTKNEQNILGKISNEICEFEEIYNEKPKIIIISKFLETYLVYYFQCNTHQIINGKCMYMFFGLCCVTSNKLKDFEFEIF